MKTDNQYLKQMNYFALTYLKEKRLPKKEEENSDETSNVYKIDVSTNTKSTMGPTIV